MLRAHKRVLRSRVRFIPRDVNRDTHGTTMSKKCQVSNGAAEVY